MPEPQAEVETKATSPRIPHDATALRCKEFLQAALSTLPWQIRVSDWTGDAYAVGKEKPHWYGAPLDLRIGTPRVAEDILSFDAMSVLERFVAGEADLSGNLYLLSFVRKYAKGFRLKPWQVAVQLLKHSAFQSVGRARVNVKYHYDIPQSVLDLYLDRRYRSYSCGLWEDAERLDRGTLVRVGVGQRDDFDSLEKAQWRKFKDAADFLAPREGETMLDIGCGYGGQLEVALESQPFGKVVGWTHSRNQAENGSRQLLQRFDRSRWELNEGDYRLETRVFDHVASTGMFCHVGPRGLAPYVRNVRKRIKTGGRYLHHGMMIPFSRVPIDAEVGIAFNKRYVWPGFHWFTPGDHVRALERNGFRVLRAIDYSAHYAKTTAAWYERMMAAEETIRPQLGEQTFRAWQVYLAGISGMFTGDSLYLYRFYCEAI